MANTSKNHTVDVTADKKITWLLEKEGEVMQRAHLANTVVN
jgi:hypothetical protein